MLQKTDIRHKLIRERAKKTSGAMMLANIHQLVNDEQSEGQQVSLESEKSGNSGINNFNFDLLESENIFHINQIRQICIDYRLRFLDSGYFKAKIPNEAIYEIEKLENLHQTSISGFKIMAPSKLLKLENADDPLLFAPLGNNYFYLIHKWGNDLHPMRKMLMKPFKNLENFLIAILLLSFFITCIIPLEIFSKNVDSVQFTLIFLFTFKSVVGVAIFYGFALGKNFSESIWNSKYCNG